VKKGRLSGAIKTPVPIAQEVPQVLRFVMIVIKDCLVFL
jgi:hypothetical protein